MIDKIERVHNALPDVTKISFTPLSPEEQKRVSIIPEIQNTFSLRDQENMSLETYEYNGIRLGYVCYYPKSKQDAEAKHLTRAVGKIVDINENGQVIGYTSFEGVIDAVERPHVHHDDRNYPSVTGTSTVCEQPDSNGIPENHREKGHAIRRLIALNKLITERYNESLQSSTGFEVDKKSGKKLGELVWLRLKDAGLVEVARRRLPWNISQERRYKFKPRDRRV